MIGLASEAGFQSAPPPAQRFLCRRRGGCLVGEIVTSFPFAYATYVGEQLVDGQKSPMLLVSSFIGLGASIAVTWKVSLLAKSVLEERETYSSLALGAVPLEQGKEGSESSFYES